VSILLRSANSQEQLKRVLDSFDIDGDTVLVSLPSVASVELLCKWFLGGLHLLTFDTDFPI